MAAAAGQWAGFWRRAVALGLDGLLAAALLLPLAVATGGGLFEGWSRRLLVDLAPALALVGFWRLRGATPGKRLMEIAVIDIRDGDGVTTGQAVIRYVGYFLSALPAYLGFLWAAWDRRKQGFHDKIARTAVVHRPEDESTKDLTTLMREAGCTS
ncbi:MAG: RDD family protein [Thiohalospira sp.]|uniref:RDD family protein n=1 Tax=Thiohalospira sp. TaxID=3080549 RepID=UPI0039805C66